ncbi:hypothetical protein IW262DRAFT_1302805 [Armillaria fumosa]|nr:hypothetical protein IW262DRAFT_1302805 [Armillaria fumosa]
MFAYFWNDVLTMGHAHDFLTAISKPLAGASRSIPGIEQLISPRDPLPAFKGATYWDSFSQTRYGKDTPVLKRSKHFVESCNPSVTATRQYHSEGIPNRTLSFLLSLLMEVNEMGVGVLQYQHTRTLLFVDVEDNVHVRSTMRKMTRALRSINMISAVVFHTASRNRKDAVRITALLPASSSNPVWFYALPRTVTHLCICDAMDIIRANGSNQRWSDCRSHFEKSYKFKKMVHFLAPMFRGGFTSEFQARVDGQVTIIYLGISQLKVTLRAFGTPDRIIRDEQTRTLLPSVFLKQVPGVILGNNDTSIAGLYSLRSFRVSSRDHIDTIVLSKARVCSWVPVTAMGDDKSIDHPEALYDPDLCSISDLVGKGRSAWAYRLYLASTNWQMAAFLRGVYFEQKGQDVLFRPFKDR